ncbi:uncharacterized protein si:zfos-741a10.4 isoform X3 [Danio rerio]
MVQDTRDLHLRLYKDFYSPSSITVFEVNVNKETKDESIRSRSEFFYENGTLIITHMSRADSGTYELHHTVSGTVYDSRLRVEVEESSESSVSVVFVVLWSLQMTLLLGLLAGFHLYMRHTSEKKPEDGNVGMSRSGEEQEDS